MPETPRRHLTLRLPEQLAQRLDTYAASIDRPRSWVIRHALTNLLGPDAVITSNKPLTSQDAQRIREGHLRPGEQIIQPGTQRDQPANLVGLNPQTRP